MKNHLVLLILLLSSSCSNFVVRPSGKVTKVQFPISDFNGIKVANGIELFLRQDNFEKIEIETDDNIQKLYRAEKVGNNLVIGLIRNVDFRPEQIVKVFISAKSLIELKATSGCKVKLDNAIIADDFNLDISDGSQMSGSLTTNKLNLNVTGGSTVKISGTTDIFNLNSSGGGQVSGFDFSSNKLNCNIGGGSMVNTTVNSKIDIVATGGAVLNYKGKATVDNQTVSSGGKVNKL